jgi:hypothetical protein
LVRKVTGGIARSVHHLAGHVRRLVGQMSGGARGGASSVRSSIGDLMSEPANRISGASHGASYLINQVTSSVLRVGEGPAYRAFAMCSFRVPAAMGRPSTVE